MAWLALALTAGALFLVAPGPTLGVAIVAFVASRRPLLSLGLACALLVGGLRARRAVDRHEQAAAGVAASGAWPARCEVRGEVVRAPVLAGDAFRIEVDGAVVCRDGPSAHGIIALHGPFSVARGDEVVALASVAPPYRFFDDGLVDPRPLAARRGVVLSGGAEDVVVMRHGRGIGAWIDRARAHVRQRIAATFPPDVVPMARALVLGEDDLAPDDREAFRRSGLSHLLAVSGTHLVLVVMGFVAAVRAGLVRVERLAARGDPARIAAALGLPVAWIYADFAGGSGSAVRAAWMCTIALVARAVGRKTEAWRALSLSVLAMTILDPLVVFDLSFDLSALATLGLLALARPLSAWLVRRVPWAPRSVVTAFGTALAATIACSPLIATMAPELPVSGLLANLVAVPLGEAAALPLCLVHALLAPWPEAEAGCALVAGGALACVRWVARAFALGGWGGLPVPSPTPVQLGIMAAVAVGLALARRRTAPCLASWLMAGFVGLVAAEALARRAGAPTGVVRVTFLDVGQGDSALVDLPDGTAILVDGGGLVGSPIDVGDRIVAPVLAARRRGALRAVVLSHPHPDHFLGLAAGLARVQPGAFWDTGQGEDEGTKGPYAALLGDLRARGVLVRHPAELCGTQSFGGATVTVLAPCPGPAPDRNANDNSFVLRIAYGKRAFLLVGDTEVTEESELLRTGNDLHADVLKIGHHGSRTSSSPAFLAAVTPSVAVISSGVRNRFGHPHASTLAGLASLAGLRVYRTDHAGSVRVTTDGTSLDVVTARGDKSSSVASADSSSPTAWPSLFRRAWTRPASIHSRASGTRAMPPSICPHIRYIAT